MSTSSFGSSSAQPIFEYFHDWQVPLTVCGVYVVTVALWNKMNSSRSAPKYGRVFDYFVMAHNFILMAYSMVSFLASLPILVDGYMNMPIFEAFCDCHNVLWQRGLYFWTNVFYLSKYYELLDTVIILLKGKQSSFLQTFHHTGAIIGMFLLCKYEAKGAFVFVVFNSFIHSIMYCYYLLTCMGYRPAWKQLLTQMQISQFIIGNPIGLLTTLVPGCVDADSVKGRGQVFAVVFNFVYVGCLVFLFHSFAEKTYKQSAKKKIN